MNGLRCVVRSLGACILATAALSSANAQERLSSVFDERRFLKGSIEEIVDNSSRTNQTDFGWCREAIDQVLTERSRKMTPEARYEAAVQIRDCVRLINSETRQRGERVDTASQDIPISLLNRSINLYQSQADFRGMNFGVGVAISKTNEIRMAEVRDSVVRVTSSVSQIPRVILEAHYYGFCKTQTCLDGDFGVGPFFGVAATDDTLTGVALGVMFGWRSTSSAPDGTTKSDGLAIGIGAVLDAAVSRLPSDFREGSAAPAGTSDGNVVLEKRSKWSPMIFFQKTF